MSDGPATKVDLIEALADFEKRLTFIFATGLIAAIAVILLVVPAPS
jgi:hypothetical protein